MSDTKQLYALPLFYEQMLDESQLPPALAEIVQ
jgi:hypothetical protein